MASKRLFGKPGLYRHIDIPELKRLYREEIELERMLSAGLPFRRTVNVGRLTRHQIEIVSEFFKEPKEYTLNRLLKGATLSP